MNEDLEMLLKELEKNKADQQALKDLETEIKADIKQLLNDNDLLDYKSELYGSIAIQKRAQKYYGEEIEVMEDQLKISKKLADDLGDYEIKGYSETITYRPPKEIF